MQLHECESDINSLVSGLTKLRWIVDANKIFPGVKIIVPLVSVFPELSVKVEDLIDASEYSNLFPASCFVQQSFEECTQAHVIRKMLDEMSPILRESESRQRLINRYKELIEEWETYVEYYEFHYTVGGN